MNEPEAAAFPVTKLAPLLRAIVDPEGMDDLPAEQAEAIRRIEANVKRLDPDA